MMNLGAVTIVYKGGFIPNKGDVFILLAAMVAPFANKYQKLAREEVGAEYLLLFRTAFAAPTLFLLGFAISEPPNFLEIEEVFWMLFLNGFVLFGISKIFWVEAIHRISITKATSMTALGPVYTMFWAYLILGDAIGINQILGAVLVIIGGLGLLLANPSLAKN